LYNITSLFSSLNISNLPLFGILTAKNFIPSQEPKYFFEQFV
jgi:hypothetical protein